MKQLKQIISNRITSFSYNFTIKRALWLILDGYVYIYCCADEMLLKEDILELLPAVEEANSISEEMDKKMEFDAVIVSPESRGVISGKPEVSIGKHRILHTMKRSNIILATF